MRYQGTQEYQLEALTVFLTKARTSVAVVRFEVFKAVNMKNDFFWDVTPCGSCKNRSFGGT
jgi:hypothetical protein